MTSASVLTEFSSDALPDKERVSMVREAVWRPLFGMDMAPQPGAPFRFEFQLLSLPGLYFNQSYMTAARLERDRRGVQISGDKVVLVCYLDRQAQLRCAGQECQTGPGNALLLDASRPVRFQVPSSRFLCLDIHRDALQPLLSRLLQEPFRLLPNSAALAMLLHYLQGLMAHPESLQDPVLQRLAVEHSTSLLALAAGASREARHEQLQPSLAQARLQQAKALIQKHFTDPGLDIHRLAGALAVSPRYLQRLFAGQQQTFTDYLQEVRLQQVYRWLQSPACAQQPISRLALEAGFADISYFNRCFRRRFAATPSEIRAQAAGR